MFVNLWYLCLSKVLLDFLLTLLQCCTYGEFMLILLIYLLNKRVSNVAINSCKINEYVSLFLFINILHRLLFLFYFEKTEHLVFHFFTDLHNYFFYWIFYHSCFFIAVDFSLRLINSTICYWIMYYLSYYWQNIY